MLSARAVIANNKIANPHQTFMQLFNTLWAFLAIPICTAMLIVVGVVPVHAQSWSGIVDPSRAITWANTGTTVPTRTQCGATIAAYGTSLASPGSAATINGAINATGTGYTGCVAPYLIQLGSGTFYINCDIAWNPGVNNVTVALTATTNVVCATETTHSCDALTTAVCITGSSSAPNGSSEENVCDWTGGYTQGATVIKLSNCGSTTPALGSAANISATQPTVLTLDQTDQSVDPGTIWNCWVNPPGFAGVGNCSNAGDGGGGRFDGPAGADGNGDRSQQQHVAVTAVQFTGTLGGFTCTSTGPCVTITPGLYMPNWSSTHAPQAWYATTTAQGNGIVGGNFDFTYSATTYGIEIQNCYKCFVSGVRMQNAARSAVQIRQSSHTLIKDSYDYQNALNTSTINIAPYDGHTSSSSCVITSASSNFISAMASPGYNDIFILGAGAGGGSLHTTVASVASGTSLTVNSPCPSTTTTTAQISSTGYAHGAQSYGIEIFNGSDNLIQNNIFQQVTDSTPSMTGAGEGNVFAYNFAIDTQFSLSNGWMQASYYVHASGDAFTLWEGNIGTGWHPDNVHGTHHFGTGFRNVFTGYQTSCLNGSCTQQTVPAIFDAGTRYYNVIGNVLGRSVQHSNYQCSAISTATCGQTEASIYALGYTGENAGQAVTAINGFCSTPSCGSFVAYDTQVANYLFRWGNYDVVTAGAFSTGVRFCGNSSSPNWSTVCASTSEVPTSIASFANAVPSSTTLPSSFYLSSRPAWYTTTYPAIGPDVSSGGISQCSGGTYANSLALSSGQCTGGTLATFNGGYANPNPAMACALNTMGMPPDGSGAVLTFNPSSCYSGTPQAATPSCTPTSGTPTLSVTCSLGATGSVMCYSTSTTPATNGSTGCTTGTLYSTAISVTVNPTTLKVIAGGTGYTDSAVASYTYTNSPTGTTISPGITISGGTSITSVMFELGPTCKCYDNKNKSGWTCICNVTP